MMARDQEDIKADRHDSERLRGFGNGLTDRQTDIYYSRVAFATENWKLYHHHLTLKRIMFLFHWTHSRNKGN